MRKVSIASDRCYMQKLCTPTFRNNIGLGNWKTSEDAHMIMNETCYWNEQKRITYQARNTFLMQIDEISARSIVMLKCQVAYPQSSYKTVLYSRLSEHWSVVKSRLPPSQWWFWMFLTKRHRFHIFWQKAPKNEKAERTERSGMYHSIRLVSSDWSGLNALRYFQKMLLPAAT